MKKLHCFKGNNSCITEDIIIKFCVHTCNHVILIHIKFKFHEVLILCHLVIVNFMALNHFKDYNSCFPRARGWLGGAMVLGKLPVPGRPTIWIIVGQGPIALAVGAGGSCFDIFVISLLFLPLFGRRSDID